MHGGLDHRSYLGTRTFAALDGVRGLMVAWVVLYHCEPSRLGLQFLRGRADFAVDVFFVLSGFLITTLLLREPPATPLQQLGRFYVRRSLRIFPLYYAAVFAYLAAVRLFGGAQAVADYDAVLPSLLFYWSDWKLALAPGLRPAFVQAWSLAVEEKFYLLWPLAVVFWPRAALRIALAGMAVVVAWRAIAISSGATETRLVYSFDLRLDALLLGAVMAILMHGERGYAVVRRAASPRVFWTAMAAMAVAMATASNLSAWRFVVVPLLAAVLLAGLVVNPRMPGTALLRTAPLCRLGVVSYCIYVIHPLCLQVGQRVCGGRPGASVDGLFEFAIGGPLSWLVAAASYRWFESPFLRLKERFRPKAPAPVSESTPSRTQRATERETVGAARD